jgi:hypothetical protein
MTNKKMHENEKRELFLNVFSCQIKNPTKMKTNSLEKRRLKIFLQH